MRERDLETFTKTYIESHGGLALKFISPGYAGSPRPLQVRCIGKLRALGFKVFVVDGKEQIGGILDAL